VDRALEIRPEYPEANRELGLYYYRGFLDYDRALEIFESVQKARPNSSPSLLGYIQRRQGKFVESVRTLEEAFKRNPRSSGIAGALGVTHMHMRRYAEAEIWYDRSLSLNPDNFTVLARKIQNSFHLKGNNEEARAILETIPPGPFTSYFGIVIEIGDRNYEEALKILDAASVDSAGDGTGMQDTFLHKDLVYAMIYRAQEKLSLMRSHADSVRLTLEEFVRDHPEDPRYHAALGKAYAYLGKKDEAIREGNQAVKLYPIAKDALVGPTYVKDLIEILILVGEYDDAIDNLEFLMSIPAGADVSACSLRSDPRFDPLRDHPRFLRLLEKYPTDN
jgi:serine/threonine-protein kinase